MDLLKQNELKLEFCHETEAPQENEKVGFHVKAEDDDEKCYLPKPFSKKIFSTFTGEMGPIGPWATGKVTFNPNVGMTGVRPVVDAYSVTRTNINEWRDRNAVLLNVGKELYQRSEDNAVRGRTAVKQLVDLVESSQKATTESLKVRLKEITIWKKTLSNAILLMQDEITKMEQQRIRLKKSLVVFGTPESIANECMSLRSNRPETELLRDRVDKHLIKELAMIFEIRNKLNDTLFQFEQQQIANRAARERLESDWSDKQVSFDIDRNCVHLNNDSKILMFSPGSMRAPLEQASGEYWRYFSESTLDDCEKTRDTSMKLRATLQSLILKSLSELRAQADKVQKAFNNRVKCLEDAIERLTDELKMCLNNIVKTEEHILELKDAIASFTAALKVAQTRMEFRSHRENVENCRDSAQQQLIDEVKTNQDGVADLYQYLDEAENCKVELISVRGRLEREIMLKRKALFQDRDRCMNLRKFYPTEEMLKEIALG